MNPRYSCDTPARRQKIEGSLTLNGIDYLEVDAGQVVLYVHMINKITVPVSADNVAIEGGVRIKGIGVVDVHVSASDDKVLEVTVSAAGDFSFYSLRIQAGIDDPQPLAGYDQRLSSVQFSFRAACPSDFDCLMERVCSAAALPSPVIDYLSKDYASFRQLMLDRLAITVPDWTERNPADVLVTLVELLAYVGDDLSYRQDAVAPEAYLSTCRRRTSARRHARLLDYRMHEGCNARTWVHFETDAVILSLPRGTQVVTGSAEQGVQVANLDAPTGGPFVVFETMHELDVRTAHETIDLWTWGDEKCCLPRGATAATLRKAAGMSLAAGDFLLLEEVRGAATGHVADADPTHRQIVRLTSVVGNFDELYAVDVLDVEWADADALTFPLCVSAIVSDGAGGSTLQAIAVARGNMALADHGRTVMGQDVVPIEVPQRGAYLPSLARPDVTFAAALTKAELTDPTHPASALATTDPRQALPAATLTSPAGTWLPRYDLLGSDRFARDFVVEMEDDRVAHIRFGDDVHGRRPRPADRFSATYRVGSGTAGNVGRGALHRIVGQKDITAVHNPLPATGGQDPELLESVKQYAPQAFQRQERAVTEADYASVATRHKQVLAAAARMRWTGSWWTVFITVERRGGLEVDLAFRQEIAGFVDQYRMAGYDIEVEAPVYVPLDVAIAFCPSDGFFAEDVKRGIVAALTGAGASGLQSPFFARDRFTFGQPVYTSQIYGAVLAVPGVASAAVTRFQRWGKLAGTELDDGRLTVSSLEVVRLDDDPNFPENGRLDVAVGGAA